MTRDELGAAADRIFRGSRAMLARALGVNGKTFTRMMGGKDHIPEGFRRDVAALERHAPSIMAGFDTVARIAESQGASPNAVNAVAAEWVDRRKQDD